jgi:hypothetical protein
MDNTPGAEAKASYFFPGTAINAVPNTQGVSVSVPTGVDARYPGNGSASGQVGAFADGLTSQAMAGSQSAQTAEGYALAQSALAGYQFAPVIPYGPITPPAGVTLPTPPAVPTISSGGSGPTATPGSGGAAPTPTSCLVVCLDQPLPAAVNSTGRGALPTQLPDSVEQQLTAALQAAQTGNPNLLSLAGGHLAAPDPTMPYAGADISSQAETRATDSGVAVTVETRAQHVQLLQGLIDFASVDSNLQAVAPVSGARGSGTITTQVTGATIGGVPVTVDNNGVTVNDQNVSAAQAQALSDALNAALTKAGVQLSLTTSVTQTDVGFWEGSGAGLEVTAEINPAGQGLPSPASGIPGTHVDFSIGKVLASVYATPGDNGSGGGSGSCDYCGSGYGSGGGGPTGGGSTTTSGPTSATRQGGSFTLPGGLSGGGLLALVFVIQGVSAATVAATAGYADAKAKAAVGLPPEEETN